MKEIRTEIEIDASPARVWEVLTTFDQFPTWNPFMRQASGQIRKGGKLEMRLYPPGGRKFVIRPTVRQVEPERTLRWLGRVVLPGLFDGEHSFHLDALDGGRRVRLIQAERFTGLLVPVVWSRLATPTMRGFEAMNRALKERAEEAAQGKGSGDLTAV